MQGPCSELCLQEALQFPEGSRAPARLQAPPTAALLGPGGVSPPYTRPRPPNARKPPRRLPKGLFAEEAALKRSHAARRAEHEVQVKPRCRERPCAV